MIKTQCKLNTSLQVGRIIAAGMTREVRVEPMEENLNVPIDEVSKRNRGMVLNWLMPSLRGFSKNPNALACLVKRFLNG